MHVLLLLHILVFTLKQEQGTMHVSWRISTKVL